MDEVVMSIRPEWVEKIFKGEKTIELRKTRPARSLPIRCFIYETRGDERYGNEYWQFFDKGKGRRKVVGEFVCEKIDRYCKVGGSRKQAIYVQVDERFLCHPIEYELLCMDAEQMSVYGGGRVLSGWHITQLKRYVDPQPLTAFGLRRAPQSWCYAGENSVRAMLAHA